ncbi:hypothetical protein ID866_6506 [Astraeus odoratus]|nr:hypothetical protein ID866_6506 [Astraeus odoratus]
MSSTAYTEAWLTGPQQTHFYTRTYRPEGAPLKAAVVFVHGFIEHVARYEHVFPAWSDRGIAVFAYDQRGFGKTALDEKHKSKDSAYAKTSWREQLEDIEWAVNHVKKEFAGVPVFLYGHSMGGALVLAFPTRPGPPPSKDVVAGLAGVIATSPLILQSKPAAKAARWVGGKASRLAPALTIPAAVNAKVTSYKASEQLHNAIVADDKGFTPYTNGFHELHNEPDGVKERLIEECITWVERHIPSAVPSKL